MAATSASTRGKQLAKRQHAMVVEPPLAFRIPAFPLAALLAVALVLTLIIAAALGRRTATERGRQDLSSLETMASGLIGLLLAFNFSIAQGRFDNRQKLVVAEANAIGTASLRCSVLVDPDKRRTCRDLLVRYGESRIAAYQAFGVDAPELDRQLRESERLQNEVWTLVSREMRAAPNPALSLLLASLNDMIDRDADRRAAFRITVPVAVTSALLAACVAWAMLLGYGAGLRGHPPHLGWVFVALLIAVVFGVAQDFDRPRSGIITTAAADRSLNNTVESMRHLPSD